MKRMIPLLLAALLVCLCGCGQMGAASLPGEEPAASSSAMAFPEAATANPAGVASVGATPATPAPDTRTVAQTGDFAVEGLELLVTSGSLGELIPEDSALYSDGSYRRAYLLDALVYSTLERSAASTGTAPEAAIQAQLARDGVEARALSVWQDALLTEFLSYPVWRAQYELGANEDSTSALDVFLFTEDWDFRFRSLIPLDWLADYEARRESWCESLTLHDPAQQDDAFLSEYDLALVAIANRAASAALTTDTTFFVEGEAPDGYAWYVVCDTAAHDLSGNASEGLSLSPDAEDGRLRLSGNQAAGVYARCFSSGGLSAQGFELLDGMITQEGADFVLSPGDPGDGIIAFCIDAIETLENGDLQLTGVVEEGSVGEDPLIWHTGSLVLRPVADTAIPYQIVSLNLAE